MQISTIYYIVVEIWKQIAKLHFEWIATKYFHISLVGLILVMCDNQHKSMQQWMTCPMFGCSLPVAFD